MKFELLPQIDSPRDLQAFSDERLAQLAAEIREALCSVVADRSAHFASNLGVVELCIALHLVFDFSRDRLIWDTGHQVYPHKLVTGRFAEFHTIRRRGGLMGYPNPVESEYDLFVTGHAGASVSTMLGLKAADDLLHADQDRKAVAVLGDGALPCGLVFEAMNNAAGLNKDLLLILNDNQMGICPRVGGLADYLDQARAGSSGGRLFEGLGFRYVGPVDGHDLPELRRTLQTLKDVRGPVLMHVFTEKGHGFEPARQDPVTFHAPAPFQRNGSETVSVRKSASRSYTDTVSDAIHAAMRRDRRIAVLTAAMCEGNKLQRVRRDFPERFFDTGICEGHAVAFAGGMAKSGMRPIVAIYSTFLQRSFDQIFQEVALQNLPVTFCLDRAGLCGPDGPTHHGVFDNSYMRMFPNMVVMAPGDELEVGPMLDFALRCDGPASIRYPKATVEQVPRSPAPIELGRAEVYRKGADGLFVAFGPLFAACVRAADRLRREGLDIGVINARFCKPLDAETILPAVERADFVLTVEENTVMGGFGSAVLEAAAAAGVRTDHVRVLGLPDRFIEHGERGELLDELGLSEQGLAAAARAMADRHRLCVPDDVAEALQALLADMDDSSCVRLESR